MTREANPKVEALCLEALARPVEDRAAFLDEACAGDSELRREVEALLGRAGDFLETPAWEVASPLEPGSRLGPYEIEAVVGRGGMGEVYLARDTRLNRAVAIKVLPPSLAGDSTCRARLEREAEAIAGLNHPHICTLYDVGREVPTGVKGRALEGGSASPLDFLVMEYLEGQTLKERLHRGSGERAGKPLKVEQAVAIAKEIADALAAAHEAGLVHRDLKPANVMLTAGGAKLLDFGLAKRTPAVVAGSRDAGRAASASVTVPGLVVGTVGYMSPEQVRGERVDARTDLFAFGCLLYEMLAGQPPFSGTTATDVVTAILRDDPAPLPADRIAPALDRIVRHCLEKERARRFQSARDLRFALDAWEATPNPSPAFGRRRLVTALVVLAGLACLAVTAGVLLWQRPALGWFAPPASALHFEISVAGTGLGAPEEVAISPDGNTIVFRAGQQTRSRLYVRDLRESTTRPLEGTEGAFAPCFSPDGVWVAFFSQGGLQRVPLGGGAPVTVYASARSERFRTIGGMSWEANDRISFSSSVPLHADLWRVSAWGGQPELLGQSDGRNPGVRFFSPQGLPGGQAFLVTSLHRGRSAIVAFRLDDRRWRTVVDGGSHPLYVQATGLLFYQAEGRLNAVPFDPERLELRGRAYAVVERVGNSVVALKEYDVSRTGTLVYLPPQAATLTWKDRRGVVAALAPRVEGPVSFLSLSPDGHRAVLCVLKGGSQQLFAADLGTEATLTRLTDGDADPFGVFTPDGRQILFTSAARDGQYNIFSIRADGGGEPTRQTNGANWQKASCGGSGPLSDVFLFNQLGGERFDIWEQRLGRPDTAKPLVRTSADELEAVFSPDGRWIAYESDISGESEIYVQGYPNGAVRSVSPGGGQRPLWNPKGGELFYQKATQVFAVRIANGARAGAVTPVFVRSQGVERNWAVAPDGERFLVADNTRSPQINIVLNWFHELETKVR